MRSCTAFIWTLDVKPLVRYHAPVSQCTLGARRRSRSVLRQGGCQYLQEREEGILSIPTYLADLADSVPPLAFPTCPYHIRAPRSFEIGPRQPVGRGGDASS